MSQQTADIVLKSFGTSLHTSDVNYNQKKKEKCGLIVPHYWLLVKV